MEVWSPWAIFYQTRQAVFLLSNFIGATVSDGVRYCSCEYLMFTYICKSSNDAFVMYVGKMYEVLWNLYLAAYSEGLYTHLIFSFFSCSSDYCRYMTLSTVLQGCVWLHKFLPAFTGIYNCPMSSKSPWLIQWLLASNKVLIRLESYCHLPSLVLLK